MDKFRWCFIGTGRLANQVAKQILDSGNHEITVCFSRNEERCKEFAKQYHARSCVSSEEALRSGDIDAVYIVTPHNAHFRYAKQALEAGKPVFCEKAFTVSAWETEELIRIARQNRLYLAEAMWTWFSPCANQVKKWIDEKQIGEIRNASFTYHMKSIGYAPRVSDPKRAGGALLDITVYPITYAYRLFGYPKKIESNAVLKNGIDVSEEIVMTFEKGIKTTISASIVDMKGLEKMKISGSEGSISSSFYHASTKAILRKGLLDRQTYKSGNQLFNSYVDEFDTVASEIREGLLESRMVPLGSTLDVMRIMDEIRKQIGLEYNDLE
ncbi:MAG: Gfo/Idh/MocA family oxidoreductase [Erysipelotrichaceae bacterium]|nr:Gfo/Idh/MocA family oxidoreductase [Erysipelotrichaceae bacterium]